MSQKRGVFIVDDHPLVREWLSQLINQQADLTIAGDASNVAQAMEKIGAAKPDVAVVDISLEGTSGLDLISQIKAQFPGVNTIVLSMHEESLYAERALRAGAKGYVMKRDVTSKILEAIRCALRGERYLSERATALLAEKLVEGGMAPASSPLASLSGRELEVFQLLGRGYTTHQVGEEMGVTLGTVQAFCARIKRKLRLKNAVELLREAVLWNDRQGTN